MEKPPQGAMDSLSSSKPTVPGYWRRKCAEEVLARRSVVREKRECILIAILN
jgi:hypothetical protein